MALLPVVKAGCLEAGPAVQSRCDCVLLLMMQISRNLHAFFTVPSSAILS